MAQNALVSAFAHLVRDFGVLVLMDFGVLILMDFGVLILMGCCSMSDAYEVQSVRYRGYIE